MAHESLSGLSAGVVSCLLAVCAAIPLMASANAQTLNRNNCLTRPGGGGPFVPCRDEDVLVRPKPKAARPAAPRAAPAKSQVRGLTINGSAPTSAGGAPASATVTTTTTSSGGAPPSRPTAGTSSGRPRGSVATAVSPRPVRALIEPAEMPPRGVAGYGVVAFTTRPLPQDAERHKAVCEAFKAALIPQDELPTGTPLAEQMVTYWPILNRNTPQAVRTVCAHLVENYALRLGLDAIGDADKKGEGLASRRGPFLIAWAPSESRFVSDSLVLVMDLSSLDSQRSFVEVFQAYRQKIVDNPQMWSRGFDVESLRRTIRDTFDLYGDGLVRLVKGGT